MNEIVNNPKIKSEIPTKPINTSFDELEDLLDIIRSRVGITDPVSDEVLLFHMESMIYDIYSMISSSFGPGGMNKIVINPVNDLYITNDGKTIMEEIDVLHPFAGSIKNLAVGVEVGCGDGTKLSILLACALLLNAVKLIKKGFHPSIIIKGYQRALNKTYSLLDISGLSATDDMIESAIFTSITGKGLTPKEAKYISKLVFEVSKNISHVSKAKIPDIEKHVKTIKRKGNSNVFLFSGLIMDEKPALILSPITYEHPNVLLVNGDLKVKSKYVNDQHTVKMYSKITKSSFSKKHSDVEKSFAESIVNSGVNVVFCEGEVSPAIYSYLFDHHVIVFQKLREDDIKKLSLILNVPCSLYSDIGSENISKNSKTFLGEADKIEIRKNNEEYFCYISSQNKSVFTFLIESPVRFHLRTVEEAVNDGLNNGIRLMLSPNVVPGGGYSELMLSSMLRIYSRTIDSNQQVVVNAFADSLESVVKAIVKNLGRDPIEALIEMKSMQNSYMNARIDISGKVVDNNDMNYLPVYDTLDIKKYSILAATDAVLNILRIDEIVMKK